jgi:uncharacterized integral membrane protein
VAERDSERRLQPRLVVGAVVVVLIVVFIVENTHQTKMRFLIPQVTAPLWTALFVAVLLGVFAGVLIARHLAAPKLRRQRGTSPPDKPGR